MSDNTLYWATSRNEELFYDGDFDSRESAIAAMLAMDGKEFWIGRVVDSWGILGIESQVEKLLESIDCDLYDSIGGDGPLIELGKSKQVELAGIIEAFLREHATLSNRVVDVEHFPERGESNED